MPAFTRRSFIQAVGLVAGCAPALALARSSYPARPVTLIVPQPAGGDADTFCRLLQPGIQQALGQPLVIDNRGGAAGNIGTTMGAKAAADGYTLTFVNQGTMALNPHLYTNPGYKVEQFEPISHMASVDLVICGTPNLPANNLQEFLELARKEPGKYTYGTAGNGSANHLAGELLASMAQIKLTHVPYRGGGPALTGALAGDTDTVVAFPLAALPHIRAGKLKALAVTGNARVDALPDVPTVAESGVPGYAFSSWFGLVAPKGTPAAIIEQVHAAVADALKDEQVVQRLHSSMMRPEGSTPQAFAKLIEQESQRWGALIKEHGIQAN